MPPPADLTALLHPAPSSISYPRAWEAEFGPYLWCYVAGFARTCADLGIRDNKEGRTQLNQLRSAGLKSVPQSWRKAFTDPYEPRAWSKFGRQQWRTLFKNEPMRLDKAAIAILILEAYAQKYRPDIDIWERVSIRPAIFYIDQYDDDFYDNHVKGSISTNTEFTQSLLAHTLQSSPVIFRKMSEPRGVTFRTAELFRDFLDKTFARTTLGPVVPFKSRPNGVGNKTPCRDEDVDHP
jgi:hypothetical protein